MSGSRSDLARAEELGTSRVQTASDSPSNTRRWSGDWKFELGGTSYSEGKDEGAAAYFRFQTRFEYHLLSWLKVFGEPEVDLYSSRLQERYDNDSYENRVRINGAYISAKPFEYFEARAGAISQEWLDMPLLTSHHRAFPGFQEILRSQTAPLKVEVVGQQLVPTSYTLNTERESKEPLPGFQTQSVHLYGDHAYVNWNAKLGHYSWTNLPDKVAFQSAVVGNSVFGGEVAAGSKLAYGFDGYFWGGEVCLCNLGVTDFDFGYMGARNQRAPNFAANAQMWYFGPHMRFGSQELDLRYINYFIESDTTVAVYAPASLGYTNRMGDGLELKYILKDNHWTLKGDWVNARTVADRDTQKTFSEFWLGVETDYAPF